MDNTNSPLQEKIDHLETMRRDFVANVSHELRTPLTVIRGYLETLLTKKHTPVELQNKIYTQMHQHSLRMEHIIEDLLLLSQLENSELTEEASQTVPVAPLLKVLEEEARRVGADKHQNITLIADETLHLIGDKKELSSLFSNIIINAVKYTPAAGDITIYWGIQENHAIFSVRDTGIGIAEEHIPRLTERFYRVDKGRSRENGGTGLGLAIAKHVLLRYEATLKVSSIIDQGTEFKCLFPIKNTINSSS